MSRLSYGLRKMNAGTIGGQSRVATPRRSRMLTRPATIEPPMPVEAPVSPPVCGDWVLLGTPDDLNLSQTAYASSFDRNGEYVYFISNNNFVLQRSWSDLSTSIPGRNLDLSTTAIPNSVITGITVDDVVQLDSQGRLHTLIWNDDTDRSEIWRWFRLEASWGGNRIWNSDTQGLGTIQSPGGGHISAIEYSPADGMLYFHITADLANRSWLLKLDPSSGIDATAAVVWDSDTLGEIGNESTGLTRTADNHLMWLSFPGGNASRFNSFNISTETLNFIDFDPGVSTYVELDLAHAQGDPSSVVALDENSFMSSSDPNGNQVLVPSSAASTTLVSYNELTVANFPEIRSVSISHSGDKGLLWVNRQTLEGGLWYKWECV